MLFKLGPLINYTVSLETDFWEEREKSALLEKQARSRRRGRGGGEREPPQKFSDLN